eukprot:COSAG03_NODE_68_length_15004_cov_6.604764_7_plen_157_part_00
MPPSLPQTIVTIPTFWYTKHVAQKGKLVIHWVHAEMIISHSTERRESTVHDQNKSSRRNSYGTIYFDLLVQEIRKLSNAQPRVGSTEVPCNRNSSVQPSSPSSFSLHPTPGGERREGAHAHDEVTRCSISNGRPARAGIGQSAAAGQDPPRLLTRR